MGLSNIVSLLGGLGAFLFGMKYMGEGLELAAGPKMNKLMETLTRNPLWGFLLGTVVTMVIQSSSATTVMVMGFINAGIMNLAQATGVIIGANIGTTITSVLIALDISGIAPVCIFLGAACLLFSRSAFYRHVGQVVLGFGILFQGLHTMSGAMASLEDWVPFQRFITTATNPILGLLVGILICAVIQSSSAAVGVLQALAMQGLMPINFAAYLICGINVGSATPLFLASIGAKNNAKRAACIYFIFDAVGALIFLPISAFTPYTAWLGSLKLDPAFQISVYHIIFKVVTAGLLLPFTGLIVKAAYFLIPKREHESEKRFLYIDPNPSVNGKTGSIIVQVQKEVERMGNLVRNNFIMAAESMLDNDVGNADKIRENEEVINYLNHAITEYLIQVNNVTMPDASKQYIGKIFHVVNDLERIGDHSINLLEKTEQFRVQGLIYSEGAKSELKEVYSKTISLFDRAISAFLRQSLSDEEASQLHAIEDSIDALTLMSEENHITRLRAGECQTDAGVVFAKALHDFERVGDHSYNIGWAARHDPVSLREI